MSALGEALATIVLLIGGVVLGVAVLLLLGAGLGRLLAGAPVCPPGMPVKVATADGPRVARYRGPSLVRGRHYVRDTVSGSLLLVDEQDLVVMLEDGADG